MGRLPIPYIPMKKRIDGSQNYLKLERMPFIPDRLESILEFCGKNLSSEHNIQSLRRFMTDLSSGPDCIFDGWIGSDRQVVAILVDTCTNPSQTGEILVGGSSQKISDENMEIIFKCLETKAFASGLRSVDFGTSSRGPVGEVFLKNRAYQPSFLTCLMRLNPGNLYELSSQKIPAVCQPLNDCYFDEYYRVLVQTFQNNPETSISSYEASKQNWKTNPFLHKS